MSKSPKLYNVNGNTYTWKEILATCEGKCVVHYGRRDYPVYEINVETVGEVTYPVKITEIQYLSLDLPDVTLSHTKNQWQKWMYRRAYKGIRQFRKQIEFSDTVKAVPQDQVVDFIMKYCKENYSEIAKSREVDYWSLHYND
jgi:translation initiation factor RLI1